MPVSVRTVCELARPYAFPVVWASMLVAGAALYQPLRHFDSSFLLSIRIVAPAAAEPVLSVESPDPAPELTFVRHDPEIDEAQISSVHDTGGSHGRFAAPANAVRRKVQVRAINPRTADELAGFFRDVSYTLTDVRQGEAVPPIKVERVPDDLAAKDGAVRKALFITALLPVILEVNHRVLMEREQLVLLRDKAAEPTGISPSERLWLEQLAVRYDTSADKLDELLRRVDIVPPSMAIAQGGIESGWGTSFAARAGNALFGQIQSVGRHSVSVPWKPGAGMPQPFSNVGEAAEAYVINLNTHSAYSAFRSERATMRERGEAPDGYRLIGKLLRYSELGQQYVSFVRQVMREDQLTDFDKAKLSSF